LAGAAGAVGGLGLGRVAGMILVPILKHKRELDHILGKLSRTTREQFQMKPLPAKAASVTWRS
jgi:hypothetical protein